MPNLLASLFPPPLGKFDRFLGDLVKTGSPVARGEEAITRRVAEGAAGGGEYATQC